MPFGFKTRKKGDKRSFKTARDERTIARISMEKPSKLRKWTTRPAEKSGKIGKLEDDEDVSRYKVVRVTKGAQTGFRAARKSKRIVYEKGVRVYGNVARPSKRIVGGYSKLYGQAGKTISKKRKPMGEEFSLDQ